MKHRIFHDPVSRVSACTRCGMSVEHAVGGAHCLPMSYTTDPQAFYDWFHQFFDAERTNTHLVESLFRAAAAQEPYTEIEAIGRGVTTTLSQFAIWTETVWHKPTTFLGWPDDFLNLKHVGVTVKSPGNARVNGTTAKVILSDVPAYEIRSSEVAKKRLKESLKKSDAVVIQVTRGYMHEFLLRAEKL